MRRLYYVPSLRHLDLDPGPLILYVLKHFQHTLAERMIRILMSMTRSGGCMRLSVQGVTIVALLVVLSEAVYLAMTIKSSSFKMKLSW